MEFKLTNKELYSLDNASQKLVAQLTKVFGENRPNCLIYYRYPLYHSDTLFSPSIVLVDREYGILVFKCYNDSTLPAIKNLEELKLDLEEYAYNLRTDINNPRKILKGRVEINSFIHYSFAEFDSDYSKNILAGDLKQDFLKDFKKINLSDEEWRSLLNIIQKLDPLSKNKNIKVEFPPQNLNEAILFNNQKICVFDEDQEKSALLENEGGMRIRGLAGTGKTIVLAWKAAYLHYLYPNKKILYTFYTKSLYNQIKWLIINFYKRYSNYLEEPNWSNLNVLHAWGGKEKEGVYSNTCIHHEIAPENYNDYHLEKQPFGKACAKLLNNKIDSVYDYILVDEAQDLPQEYFKLLAKLSKNKSITIAYDELQSLEDIQMPGFVELFGKVNNELTIPLLKENDIILRKSYRSSMKILHAAIALGFGIYSEGGFTQMIDSDTNWKAIGYDLKVGELKSENLVELERPKENSPNNVEEVYDKISSLNVKTFLTKEEERIYVIGKIIQLIKEEKVNPKDILVINLPGKNVKNDFIQIQTSLFSEGINTKIPGIIDEADDFFVDGHVTLSTALRAKGNEAPIVFVLGLEKIIASSDEVWQRINRSFTFVSMTRAKGWCFLSASGDNAPKFLEEYNKIEKDFPRLKFSYPSDKQMEKIRQINYITKDERSKREYFDDIDAINKLLKSDNKYLPEDLLKRLKEEIDKKLHD